MSVSINDATTIEIGLDPVEKSVEGFELWSLRDVSKKTSQICFILSRFTNLFFKYDRLPDNKNLTLQSNSPRPNKYEWCDGIRGIAAFVVLFHHIQCALFGEGVNAHVSYLLIGEYFLTVFPDWPDVSTSSSASHSRTTGSASIFRFIRICPFGFF